MQRTQCNEAGTHVDASGSAAVYAGSYLCACLCIGQKNIKSSVTQDIHFSGKSSRILCTPYNIAY